MNVLTTGVYLPGAYPMWFLDLAMSYACRDLGTQPLAADRFYKSKCLEIYYNHRFQCYTWFSLCLIIGSKYISSQDYSYQKYSNRITITSLIFKHILLYYFLKCYGYSIRVFLTALLEYI